MWEFPNIEGKLTKKDILERFSTVKKIEEGIENTHIFTHKKWYMKSYFVKTDILFSDYAWVSLEEIKKEYAIPTAFMPFLEYLEGRLK